MRYRIMDLIRRGTSAAVLLSGFALGTSTVTLAADGNVPQNTPAFYQPYNSQSSGHDEIYRQAGARLYQQQQQHAAQHRFIAMQQGQAPVQPDVPAGEAQAPAPPADNAAPQNGAQPAAPAEAAPAEEKKEEPWSIMSIFDDDNGGNWMKDNGWVMGGWIAAGYSNHFDGSFTGNSVFLDDHEWKRFNLNQGYFYLGKVADGTKGMDWGFRADIIYGVDGNDTQAFGNPINRWDFVNGWDHGIYEWAMPQLYGEIAMDTLSIKAGHFYTPIGYEVVTTPDNFFFSKQITFYNSEPFTHTGVLGTWKASDQVTFIGGWALGWDTGFAQVRHGNMGLYGVTYNPTDKTSLVYAGGAGNFGWRGIGSINSFILSHKWTDKLQSVHQFDVLQTNNGTSFGGPAAAGIAGDSTGQINYLFYDLSDMFRLGLRQEWYKADGISYNTLTYGVNIKPTQNIVIRPEMRHMFANTPSGAGLTQTIDNIYGDNDVFGIDVIFKF